MWLNFGIGIIGSKGINKYLRKYFHWYTVDTSKVSLVRGRIIFRYTRHQALHSYKSSQETQRR